MATSSRQSKYVTRRGKQDKFEKLIQSGTHWDPCATNEHHVTSIDKSLKQQTAFHPQLQHKTKASKKLHLSSLVSTLLIRRPKFRYFSPTHFSLRPTFSTSDECVNYSDKVPPVGLRRIRLKWENQRRRAMHSKRTDGLRHVSMNLSSPFIRQTLFMQINETG